MRSRHEWHSWLGANAARSAEVWIAIAKKNSRAKSPTYDEAVEEALCYGWIDSQIRSLDADFVAHRFTPRRAGSRWSESNLIRIKALIDAGMVTEAGMLAFENRLGHNSS